MARLEEEYRVNSSGFSSEHAAAVLVIGSLAMLMLIRRGFRGIGAPGVGSVNLG